MILAIPEADDLRKSVNSFPQIATPVHNHAPPDTRGVFKLCAKDTFCSSDITGSVHCLSFWAALALFDDLSPMFLSCSSMTQDYRKCQTSGLTLIQIGI